MTRRSLQTTAVVFATVFSNSHFIFLWGSLFRVFVFRIPVWVCGKRRPYTTDSVSTVLNNMNDVLCYLLFGMLFFGGGVFVFRVFRLRFRTPNNLLINAWGKKGLKQETFGYNNENKVKR